MKLAILNVVALLAVLVAAAPADLEDRSEYDDSVYARRAEYDNSPYVRRAEYDSPYVRRTVYDDGYYVRRSEYPQSRRLVARFQSSPKEKKQGSGGDRNAALPPRSCYQDNQCGSGHCHFTSASMTGRCDPRPRSQCNCRD